MDMVWWPEGHHGGSIEFIFTKLINLVSLEQFHHKPMGMYADGPAFFLGVIARCFNGRDEPHLPHSGN